MTDPQTLTIGELTFTLRRSDRRKTVGITVDRDGSLILSAPTDCPLDLVERTAREKQFWVYTKLAEKEARSHPLPRKEFVNGEGFSYLGRSYRLRLIKPSTPELPIPALRLHQGRFLLQERARTHAREHFIAWYTEHGRPWLCRRVALFADRIGVAPRAIALRPLGYRWGSCTADGQLNFHWRTILLPPRIVEYIVAHELVHLCEGRHDKDFWKRLERAMPDFDVRKQWLAEYGVRYDL